MTNTGTAGKRRHGCGKKLIVKALRKLPEKERIIVSLCAGEELSFEEAGLVLGTDPSEVKRIFGETLKFLGGEVCPPARSRG